MAGGLLNIKSQGASSLMLFGNPKKTFFKVVYKAISNFGMQRFRIDQLGNRNLGFTSETEITFKIPRYADLLYELFFAIDLPDIWSSPYYNEEHSEWTERGFAWIREIGTAMIKSIEIKAGGYVLANYSGEYISCMAHRDFEKHKLDLFNEMTGNVPELNSPDYAFNRTNVYPNAYYNGSTNIRPSIVGRKLYVPLDTWFSKSPGSALPLTALQYTEVEISITLRPIRELYVIRDLNDYENYYPRIAPNANILDNQIHRFLSPPEDTSGNVSFSQNTWNANPHLIGTYIFLSDEERHKFSRDNYEILIRDIFEHEFLNSTGTRSIEMETKGLVSNMMFRLRRSDVGIRNEWSNYTNWNYYLMPYNLANVNTDDGRYSTPTPNGPIFTTGNYNPDDETANRRDILQSMSIVLDGQYRENELDQGIYQYIEKYNRTKGANKHGLYIYSYAFDTNSYTYQPSGGMNLDNFESIQLNIQTLEPPHDPSGAFTNICDEDGNIIGTRKNTYDMNKWNYDMKVFEERFNYIRISSGMIGLAYAR